MAYNPFDEPGCSIVVDWPFEDLDVSIASVGGLPEIIELTGYGKSKTIQITWSEGCVESVTTVVV